MEDSQPGRFQLLRVAFRAASGSRDEFHALIDHKADDFRIANKRLCDIHAERLVRELAHFLYFFAHGIQLAGRGFDDTEGTRFGNGGRKLRACNPTHGSLNHWRGNAQHLGDSISELHFSDIPS